MLKEFSNDEQWKDSTTKDTDCLRVNLLGFLIMALETKISDDRVYIL